LSYVSLEVSSWRRIVVIVSVAAAAAVVAGLAATPSRAGGGGSVASAPQLPLGQSITSGGNGDEFWRVQLSAGDTFVVDYQPVDGADEVDLYVYSPDVTDDTIDDTNALSADSAYGKREFTWTAPRAGNYVFQVSGALENGGYQMTAQVQKGGVASVTASNQISGAPNLPLGTTFVSGGYGGEFWRVPLSAGDKLVIDYQPIDTDEVDLNIYAPTVTDYTVGQANSVVSDNAQQKSEFTWTATGSGSWILDVSAGGGGAGYEMTARVIKQLDASLASASVSMLHEHPVPHKGTLIVQVSGSNAARVPNGAVGGTLSGYWAEAWHRLNSATARSDEIVLPYKIPAAIHGPIRINITVGGGNYLGKTISLRGITA
jgi:hypothetical protein